MVAARARGSRVAARLLTGEGKGSMFQHDYLMRMIMQLIEAINRSMVLAKGGQQNPAAAADMLEAAVSGATELDGGVLLSLSPESIADILSVSGTDPRVVEYVARTLYLESEYLYQAGNEQLSDVRYEQALALAQVYGFSLDEELGPEAAMEAYLEEQRKAQDAAEQYGCEQGEL